MTVESFCGDTPAYFAHVTMHRARRCTACGALLRRGTAARLASFEGRAKRRILCVACSPGEVSGVATPPTPTPQAQVPADATAYAAAMVAVSVPAIPELGGPARGSLAIWMAVGVLGVGALLGSRTGRRLLTTTGVALKAAATGVADKIRGRDNVGPPAVRRAFEDLGPTYVKLGQLVASSQGLFPEPYCLEFRKCLDRVKPFAYEDVQRILAAELGRDPHEVFASIEREPLASASIAQVHAARLRDGQEVVIKVQRPAIAKLIEADLRVLRLGARAMSMFPNAELANPVGVVADFESTIRSELDFRLEAENMGEFNRIMLAQRQSRVAAPRVIGDLSTPRILVMERFFGHRVDDVEKLRASKVDAEGQLLLGMRAWFQCMILHGFFHGDVHAGNLMALDDGRVGFLDFGIVGRFTRERREQVTDYLVAFATGDFAKLAQVMVAMGSIDAGKIDVDKLGRDLAEAYEPMLSNQLTPPKYADIIPTIMRTGVKHGMHMPRDFVLVVKQMLYFDRYAKKLAPTLNVFRDPRVVSGLMEDMMQARLGLEGAPSPAPQTAATVSPAPQVAIPCT